MDIQGLRSRKAIALLAYVAAHNKALPRAHLAELFWPGVAEERSHANLRWVLNHLTSLLPGALTIQRHTVLWGKALSCDLHTFSRHLQRNSSASLAVAADLYRGDFMAGFVLDGAPDFELWMAGERERWLQQALQVISTLAHHAGTQGNAQTAIRYFRRWLDLAPWHEEAHRRLIYWLATTGQYSAALTQYKLCANLLADELGVAPSAETTALYEEIVQQGLDGKPTPLSLPSPKSAFSILPLPAHNLPRQLMPVIGREKELAYIAMRLADPACAWLTLLGPGGIGKSCLAIEAAYNQLVHFADGVWLAPLAGTGAAELLPAAIAQTLAVPLQTDSDLRTQLLDYLSDKQLLLLLDNFEHLLEGIELLDAIVQQAPQVKLLITSREYLHHQAEWVLDVGGLAVPPEDEIEDISRYSAVELFVQSAHRSHATYALSSADAPYVAQICRNLAGMPLGIKLAAAWVRTMSCATISTEITRNLDFAALAPYGLPDRHLSLRAVINSSWQLLTAEEQAVMAKLALFRREFGLEGAQAVAGAGAKVLARLVDKSMLHVDHSASSPRYSMHELLCQFGGEQLAARGEVESTRRAHALYFMEWLSQLAAALTGPNPQIALLLIDLEIDNVRAAWQWVLLHSQADAILAAAPVISLYHDYRTLLQEALQLFSDATEILQGNKSKETTASKPLDEPLNEQLNEIAIARVLGYYGLYLFRFNHVAEAEKVLFESLALAECNHAVAEMAYAFYVLGYNSVGAGKAEVGEEWLLSGLRLAESIKDDFLVVKILYAMGWYYGSQGRTTDSLAVLERGLTLARKLGDLRSEAHILSYLGRVRSDIGDFEEAKRRHEESLHLFQTLDIQWGIAQTQWGLLQAVYERQNFAEAKRLCEIVIPLYEKMKAHASALESVRKIYEIVRQKEALAE